MIRDRAMLKAFSCLLFCKTGQCDGSCRAVAGAQQDDYKNDMDGPRCLQEKQPYTNWLGRGVSREEVKNKTMARNMVSHM